jgi:hypothetical protein
MHDYEAHCGYFLNAEIEFGKSLPDITHAWIAKAGYIRSKLKESSDPWDTSEFYVRKFKGFASSSYISHHESNSHGPLPGVGNDL